MSNKSRYRSKNESKKAAAPVGFDDWEPIRIDSTAPPVDVETFELFSVDDTSYRAPKQVAAGVALEALHVAYTRGPAAAAWFIVDSTVGEDNIAVLYSQPSLTHADVQRMLQRLGQVFWGQVEDLVGKSPVGQEG